MESIIFNPTDNNTTINSGDIILIKLTKTKPLASLTSINYTWNPLEDIANTHINEIRWSIDGINYSPWATLPINGSLDFTNLSAFIASKTSEVLFEFRFTRNISSGVSMSLETIILNYVELTIEEQKCCYTIPTSLCGTFSTGEYGSCSKMPNACAGITIRCDTSLFRPEDFAHAMSCLYEKIANASANMFGWTVYYFRVEPQQRSRDIILHEYTLYDVVDAKIIKVLVPNNEFPSEEISYSSFDMDFVDDFEVHIMRDHFHSAFGNDKHPDQRDYLFFPLQNRLWEVHSSYASKADFMQTSVYWKVKLFKWQDKKNVVRTGDIETFINNLTVNFEEVFREEEIEEFDRATHPIQYTPVGINLTDHIRYSLLEDLIIEDLELENYFTRIAKNNYDLTSIVTPNIPVLWYREICDYSVTDNLSFSCWFNSTKTNFGATTNNSTIIIDSKNGNPNGVNLKINYGLLPGSGLIDSFTLDINGTIYTFDTLPVLAPDIYYGMVLNISNTHGLIDMRIWKIGLPSANSTKLIMIYNRNFSWVPNPINSGQKWSLYSGTLKLSNLRLWKEPIPEESQSLILNQYTVKDSHNLRMADNALKPLITTRLSGR